jgi:hypothetical protein
MKLNMKRMKIIPWKEERRAIMLSRLEGTENEKSTRTRVEMNEGRNIENQWRRRRTREENVVSFFYFIYLFT